MVSFSHPASRTTSVGCGLTQDGVSPIRRTRNVRGNGLIARKNSMYPFSGPMHPIIPMIGLPSGSPSMRRLSAWSGFPPHVPNGNGIMQTKSSPIADDHSSARAFV
jgi:hypothetical protein